MILNTQNKYGWKLAVKFMKEGRYLHRVVPGGGITYHYDTTLNRFIAMLSYVDGPLQGKECGISMADLDAKDFYLYE